MSKPRERERENKQIFNDYLFNVKITKFAYIIEKRSLTYNIVKKSFLKLMHM